MRLIASRQQPTSLILLASDKKSQIDSMRRSVLSLPTASTIFFTGTPFSAAAKQGHQIIASPIAPETITVPLKFTGQELLVYYRVDGSLFRAVLDTGSPFLMVPGSCSENTKLKTGCYRSQGVPSGLGTTVERFDGFEGEVQWRTAPFSFVNATGSMRVASPLITFGVASDDIMTGPGGVFFGMIRDTDDRIRPSFLGQTPVQSFQIDLSNGKESSIDENQFEKRQRTLTLSTVPLIYHDYIRLTSDLRRLYGDPVNHYTARAQSILVNGIPLASSSFGKPIYVIFDTGVTGMVISRELFNERYTLARQRRERNLWGNVTVQLPTAQKKTVNLSATKPLTTPIDPQAAWKKFRRGGHLIILGLSFLDGNTLTIDIDQNKLWIER